MARRILVAKGNAVALYGASKSSATSEETALTPDDLAEGSIGIYGLNDIDAGTAGNTDMMTLLTIATSGAGTTADSDFAGKYIKICQGTADGCVESGAIDITGITKGYSLNYSAPVKQVLSIGYNITAAAGAMNLPGTIAAKDDIMLKLVKFEEGTNDRTPLNFFLHATDSESQYSIMTRLRTLIDEKGKDRQFVSRVQLAHNVAGTVFANSAVTTVTYGATTLTTDAAHGVGVNDYVGLDGDLYKAITGTTGTTLVIDKPYMGPTGTVSNANSKDLGATIPTEMGLRITAYANHEIYGVAVQGILEDATILQDTAYDGGIGNAVDVQLIEKKELAYRGQIDTVDANVKQLSTFTDLTKTYNMLFLEWVNSQGGFSAAAPEAGQSKSELVIAFVDENQTATYNMADVQVILATLFPAFVAIA